MSESQDRYDLPRDDERFWGKLGNEALEVVGEHGRETHFIEIPDDRMPDGRRRLSVRIFGDLDGVPVIIFHGSPGSGTGPKLDENALRGVKLIAPERPGYGDSDAIPDPSPELHPDFNPDRDPVRRPIDTVEDMKIVVQYLKDNGILGAEEKFAVVGRSGGGPHALACAAKLPGVERAAILGSLAPRKVGVGEFTAEKFPDIEKGVKDIRERRRNIQADRSWLVNFLRTQWHRDDERHVTPALEEEIKRTHWEGTGDKGWEDDFKGQQDWGFDPREITVPTLIWQGGKDPFSEKGNGRWLVENIPNAEEIYFPEASHFRASQAIMPSVLRWCATGQYRWNRQEQYEIINETSLLYTRLRDTLVHRGRLPPVDLLSDNPLAPEIDAIRKKAGCSYGDLHLLATGKVLPEEEAKQEFERNVRREEIARAEAFRASTSAKDDGERNRGSRSHHSYRSAAELGGLAGKELPGSLRQRASTPNDPFGVSGGVGQGGRGRGRE